MMTDLSAVLDQVRLKHGIVAMAGIVVERGRVIAAGACGERKSGSGIKVTMKDRWHLGSCTKAMTATLIARLVEQGRLRWDETVGEALGDTLDVAPAYQDVTLTELLQHRGGVAAATDGSDPLTRLAMAAAARAGEEIQAARLAFAGAVLGEPPARPRGMYFYSNAGYIIAAVMAERAAGASWEELVEREVFVPLGMRSVDFGEADAGTNVEQPWAHTLRNGVPVPIPPGPAADNIPAYGPAGRLHASLKSWSTFVTAHLAGAAGSTEYLSADSWTRLHTPPAGGEYAMGWESLPRDWAGGAAWTHSGSNGSNFAVVWAAPARDGAILITCNQGGELAAQACNDAAAAIGQALLHL